MSEKIREYSVSSLNRGKLKSLITDSENYTIVTNWVELRILCDTWLKVVNWSNLELVRNEYEFLNSVLDFEILKSRLEILSSETDPFAKLSLVRFIPEILEIDKSMLDHLRSIPKSLEKAEAWFRGYVSNFCLDSTLEAVIYFYKKGEIEIDKSDLKEQLRIAINYEIAREFLYNKGKPSIEKRAKEWKIPLSEALELIDFNSIRPSILSYRDNESEFIDTTFIRTIECLEISGFDSLIADYIGEISSSYQNELDKISSLLFLFQVCRSDLTMRTGNRVGLEALLQIFAFGTIDKKKPWRVSGARWSRKAKVIRNVDYVMLAGVIVFSWTRIKPQSLNGDIFNNSISFLTQSQLEIGAWPQFAGHKKGDLLTTVISIYALSCAKPIGWKNVVRKAKDWLISQQDDVGCWDISGGPLVYINSFCLEAICLANESIPVPFSVGSSIFQTELALSMRVDYRDSDTIVLCEGESSVTGNGQFDARCFGRIFELDFPKTLFYSVGSCDDVINDKNGVFCSLSYLFPKINIVRVVDRDDLNDLEVLELNKRGIRVLSLRNIESYLLNDEVIKKLCKIHGREDMIAELLEVKSNSIINAVNNGKAVDDLKPIAGDLYNYFKDRLKLTREGKHARTFLRDYISPLITPDLEIYKKLRNDIFNL